MEAVGHIENMGEDTTIAGQRRYRNWAESRESDIGHFNSRQIRIEGQMGY